MIRAGTSQVVGLLEEGVARGFSRSGRDSGACGIVKLDKVGMRFFLADEIVPLWRFEVDADVQAPDGPCLVHMDDDVDDDAYLLDDEAPEPGVVAKAIAGMYVGCCEGGAVSAASLSSLFELLPRHQARLQDAVRVDWDLAERAFAAVGGDDDYCGRCRICTCGEPGCGSEFSWKRAGSVLLHFFMSGIGLGHVLVLPHLRPVPDRTYPSY